MYDRHPSNMTLEEVQEDFLRTIESMKIEDLHEFIEDGITDASMEEYRETMVEHYDGEEGIEIISFDHKQRADSILESLNEILRNLLKPHGISVQFELLPCTGDQYKFSARTVENG